MEINQQIIDALFARRTEELAAIIQYQAHRSMAEFWGYTKLVEYYDEIIGDEQKHYKLLGDRLCYFGITPDATIPSAINIGQDVPAMHRNDNASEENAISNYNSTMSLCSENGDNGTWLIISEILKDEEDHRRDWKGRLVELDQMGEANYLSAKL